MVGDLFNPLDVEHALHGVTRVAFVAAWHPHLLDAAVSVATQAPRAGVEAIVGLTQWLASPTHAALSTRQSWLSDRVFAQVPGVAHVTVNPGFFADNYLAVLPMAANLGVFPFSTGGRSNAPPSNEDIARVMVATMLDPLRYAGRTFRPTGPTLLTGDDLAQVIGTVLGRRVRHVDVPIPSMMRAIRAQRALGPFMLSQMQRFLEDSVTGVWEHGGPTAHVHDLTGREPESFETITRRYAARPENQRSFGNLARILVSFARLPFVSGADAGTFEREQHHPQPATAVLSGRSPRWFAEHTQTASVELAGSRGRASAAR